MSPGLRLIIVMERESQHRQHPQQNKNCSRQNARVFQTRTEKKQKKRDNNYGRSKRAKQGPRRSKTTINDCGTSHSKHRTTDTTYNLIPRHSSPLGSAGLPFMRSRFDSAWAAINRDSNTCCRPALGTIVGPRWRPSERQAPLRLPRQTSACAFSITSFGAPILLGRTPARLADIRASKGALDHVLYRRRSPSLAACGRHQE